MPLIPEARAIKDVLRDADAHAAAVAEELLELEAPEPEPVAALLCIYIGFKYLLPGQVSPGDTLEELGRRSLEQVRRSGNTVAGMDVLPHCGSASSATHKKILLLLALQRELGVKIEPRQGADCETVAQLAALLARLLSEKARPASGV